jgi:hypothetical protein
MFWRFGILAAFMVWLFPAGPAGAAVKRHTDGQGVIHISNHSQAKAPSRQDPAAAPGPESPARPAELKTPHAVLAEADIEVRNGTRTQDLARLTRTLLSLEGFSVTEIGNHIDFGAQATVLYYRDGAESAARALQAKIFPWAKIEESAGLKNGTMIKVLLGSDLLEQPRMMARLTGEEPAPSPSADQPKISQPGQQSHPLASTGPDAARAPETPAALAAPAPAPATTGLSPAREQNYDALPLPKVSQAPAAAPVRLAALKPPEKAIPGGIRRHRDAQGVVHISNVAPASADAAAAILAAENHSGPPAAPESGPTLQKVSWSPDNHSPAYLPVSTAAARLEAPAGAAPIRRYRDSKGVIHIDNEESPPAPLPAPRLQARVRPGAEPGSLFRPVTYDAVEAVIPAVWSGEGPPRPRQAAVSGKAEAATAVTTEGGIRRWRDKKGVWHIKTPEYPRPAAAPRLTPLTGPNPGLQVAGLPSATGPPAVAGPAPAAAPGAPLTTITAFRDSKGRLKITSKEPSAPQMARPPAAGATAPAELEPLMAEAAQAHKLPVTLVRAVVKTESNFCSWAVSPKGAMGLMQLMPGTAAFLGVAEPFNPRENLYGGCRYLRLLIDSFGGNVPLALAAYNAGYQRVINSGYQVPAIKETQDFVTQVMGRYLAEEKKRGLPWT